MLCFPNSLIEELLLSSFPEKQLEGWAIHEAIPGSILSEPLCFRQTGYWVQRMREHRGEEGLSQTSPALPHGCDIVTGLRTRPPPLQGDPLPRSHFTGSNPGSECNAVVRRTEFES